MKKWYFVSHLAVSDQPENGMPFEIQVLNSAGQAVARGYVDEMTTMLEIQGKQIPVEVILAAKQLKTGNGNYVDEKGITLPPF